MIETRTSPTGDRRALPAATPTGAPAMALAMAPAILMIAAVLFGFGTVLILIGAAYLQDIRLLAEAPAAFWAFVCGQPLTDAMLPAVMGLIGMLCVVAAAVLAIRPGAQRGVRPSRKPGWLIAGVMLSLALTAGGVGYALGEVNRANQQPPPAIAYLDPPRLMPDFALTNAEGELTRLSDLRGKTVLLFFGYTHCPDVCPLALSDLRRVKAALGGDAQHLAVVFVSVDGRRDSPAVLRRYVTAFDPAFVGLTGSERDVRRIALEYGAHFRVNRSDADAGSYTVDHSADTFVIDAQGRWRMAYALGAPIEAVVREVRKIIRESA